MGRQFSLSKKVAILREALQSNLSMTKLFFEYLKIPNLNMDQFGDWIMAHPILGAYSRGGALNYPVFRYF